MKGSWPQALGTTPGSGGGEASVPGQGRGTLAALSPVLLLLVLQPCSAEALAFANTLE